MALTRDSEKCRKCEFYNECDEKRMELCGYIAEDHLNTLDMSIQYTMPNAISIVDCITDNIEAAELRRQLEKELYKSLGCGFLKEGC